MKRDKGGLKNLPLSLLLTVTCLSALNIKTPENRVILSISEIIF